jgi:hypothetical protein
MLRITGSIAATAMPSQSPVQPVGDLPTDHVLCAIIAAAIAGAPVLVPSQALPCRLPAITASQHGPTAVQQPPG